MANDNQLQIDIVISPEKAKAQMAAAMGEITRTAEDIFAKSATRNATTRKPTVDSLYAEVKGIDAVSQAMSRQDQIARALGIRSQTEAAKRLALLDEFRQGLDRNSAGYSAALQKIETQTNLLTHGNARARGEFHKMTAALASLTFEVTGAVYGLTALGAAMFAPAIAGARFMKSIEDAKFGMTGILLSMGKINGESLKFGQAFAVAGAYVKELQADSIRYGISLEKLVEVNRASLGGGLSRRGLGLPEIREIASVGAVATSMLGLNSQQYVQEVRDILQGGIQAASSTLATSLGLTDKILNEWTAKGGTVYRDELMKRFKGFADVAEEFQKSTLSGAWNRLTTSLNMMFVSESGFTGLKKLLNDVADSVATVDKKTGELKFNPALLDQVQTIWDGMLGIARALKTIFEIFVDMLPYLTKIAQLFLTIWAVEKIILFGAAISSVFTKATAGAVGLRAALTGLGAGGLIGLALFATYEVADYFGIIDKIFKSAEDRLNEFKSSVANASQEVLKQQLKILENEEKSKRASYGSKGLLGRAMSTDLSDIADNIRKQQVLRDLITKNQEGLDLMTRVGGVSPPTSGDGNKKLSEYDKWLERLRDERRGYEDVLEAQNKLTTSEKTRSTLLDDITKITDKKLRIEMQSLIPLADQNILLEQQKTKILERNKAWDEAIKKITKLREETEKANAKQELSPVQASEQQLKQATDQLATYQQALKSLRGESIDYTAAAMGGGFIKTDWQIVQSKPKVPTVSEAEKQATISHLESIIAEIQKAIPSLTIHLKLDKQEEIDKIKKQAADIDAATSKMGISPRQQLLNDIRDAEKLRDEYRTTDKDKALEQEKVVIALRKKHQKEIIVEWRKDFASLFDGLLVPGTNIMDKLAENFGRILNQQMSAAVSNIVGNTLSGSEQSSGDWVMAIIGALGAAVSAGSASASEIAAVTAAEMQKQQGVGSVLGDATARSDSILKSLEMISKSSFAMSDNTYSMMQSLKSVEKSMGNFVNVLAKSIGGDIAASMGVARQSSAGSFWTQSDITVKNTGLLITGFIKDLMKGVGVGQFAAGTSTTSGLWGTGIGATTETWKIVSSAPPQIAKALGDIYSNIAGTLKNIAVSLSSDMAAFDSVFNSFQTTIGELSLEGLSAADKVAALNAAIGKDADLLSEQLFPAMRQFQVAGEGMLQTITRVALEIATVDNWFKALGKSVAMSTYAVDAMVKELGGVEMASELMGKFIKNFAPATAQLEMAGRQLSAAGLPLLKTAKDWWEFMQDATPEQTVAILNNQDAISSWVSQIDSATQSLKDLISQDAFRTLEDFTRAQSYASQGIYYGKGMSSATTDRLQTATGTSTGGVVIDRAGEDAASAARTAAANAKLAEITEFKKHPVYITPRVLDPAWRANLVALQSEYDNMPKFANGGFHAGGLALVGEQGPELINTGPAMITNNSDTRRILNTKDVSEAIDELRMEMRAALIAIAQNTGETAKITRRWEGDGLPETRVVTA